MKNENVDLILKCVDINFGHETMFFIDEVNN